ncbi:MAG: Gfo/Idh/MocA family oxidoreductase, partial [Desulfobaccales bacterium]
MVAPLRVGVIGVGYLGRFHAEKYAHLQETDLVGVADLNEAQAREVAGALGAEAYGDYRELLPKVSAVSIAVPTSLHFEVVRDALKAGCQVLVEKPISVTVAEADSLVRLARERGRILMVGHLERFNSAMEELKSRVHGPRFIESHRLAFFKERGTDVDVVLDLMIHDLDHVLSLVQAPVQEIRAAGISVLTDRIDLANARLEFGDGCIANLTASRMSFKSMRKFRLFQTDAYLAVDFEDRELTVAFKKEGA